jgi:hypothetical protein
MPQTLSENTLKTERNILALLEQSGLAGERATIDTLDGVYTNIQKSLQTGRPLTKQQLITAQQTIMDVAKSKLEYAATLGANEVSAAGFKSVNALRQANAQLMALNELNSVNYPEESRIETAYPAKENLYSPEQAKELLRIAGEYKSGKYADNSIIVVEFGAHVEHCVKYDLPINQAALKEANGEINKVNDLRAADAKILDTHDASFVINPSQLEEVERTQVRNDSIRTLQQLNLDVREPFVPSPFMTKDQNGRPVQVGVTAVNRDPETGEITSVEYINPKDSGDRHAVQKFAVKEGVLVLPTSTIPEASELAGKVSTITHGEHNISLAQFDQVLKETHAWYEKKGLVPDIYNSNTSKFPYDSAKDTFGSHETDAPGVYRRAGGMQEILIVRGKSGEAIAFSGVSEHVGTQYGEGEVILRRENDGRWRKLDAGYAHENLRNPDGSPIDWKAVATVSTDAIKAPLLAGHESGQEGNIAAAKTVTEARQRALSKLQNDLSNTVMTADSRFLFNPKNTQRGGFGSQYTFTAASDSRSDASTHNAADGAPLGMTTNITASYNAGDGMGTANMAPTSPSLPPLENTPVLYDPPLTEALAAQRALQEVQTKNQHSTTPVAGISGEHANTIMQWVVHRTRTALLNEERMSNPESHVSLEEFFASEDVMPERCVKALSLAAPQTSRGWEIETFRHQTDRLLKNGHAGHAFLVAALPVTTPAGTVEKSYYLIDPTFRQFTKRDNPDPWVQAMIKTPEGHALVQGLLTHGYMPLTEQTAEIYLGSHVKIAEEKAQSPKPSPEVKGRALELLRTESYASMYDFGDDFLEVGGHRIDLRSPQMVAGVSDVMATSHVPAATAATTTAHNATGASTHTTTNMGDASGTTTHVSAGTGMSHSEPHTGTTTGGVSGHAPNVAYSSVTPGTTTTAHTFNVGGTSAMVGAVMLPQGGVGRSFQETMRSFFDGTGLQALPLPAQALPLPAQALPLPANEHNASAPMATQDKKATTSAAVMVDHHVVNGVGVAMSVREWQAIDEKRKAGQSVSAAEYTAAALNSGSTAMSAAGLSLDDMAAQGLAKIAPKLARGGGPLVQVALSVPMLMSAYKTGDTQTIGAATWGIGGGIAAGVAGQMLIPIPVVGFVAGVVVGDGAAKIGGLVNTIAYNDDPAKREAAKAELLELGYDYAASPGGPINLLGAATSSIGRAVTALGQVTHYGGQKLDELADFGKEQCDKHLPKVVSTVAKGLITYSTTLTSTTLKVAGKTVEAVGEIVDHGGKAAEYIGHKANDAVEYIAQGVTKTAKEIYHHPEKAVAIITTHTKSAAHTVVNGVKTIGNDISTAAQDTYASCKKEVMSWFETDSDKRWQATLTDLEKKGWGKHVGNHDNHITLDELKKTFKDKGIAFNSLDKNGDGISGKEITDALHPAQKPAPDKQWQATLVALEKSGWGKYLGNHDNHITLDEVKKTLAAHGVAFDNKSLDKNGNGIEAKEIADALNAHGVAHHGAKKPTTGRA